MTIYEMSDPEGESILAVPLGPGTTRESLERIWAELEELRANGFETCQECSRAVAKDPRGDVLDSSGRCNECRP